MSTGSSAAAKPKWVLATDECNICKGAGTMPMRVDPCPFCRNKSARSKSGAEACECGGSGELRTGGQSCVGCAGRGYRDSEGFGEAWQYKQEEVKKSGEVAVSRGKQLRLLALLEGEKTIEAQDEQELEESEEDFD